MIKYQDFKKNLDINAITEVAFLIGEEKNFRDLAKKLAQESYGIGIVGTVADLKPNEIVVRFKTLQNSVDHLYNQTTVDGAFNFSFENDSEKQEFSKILNNLIHISQFMQALHDHRFQHFREYLKDMSKEVLEKEKIRIVDAMSDTHKYLVRFKDASQRFALVQETKAFIEENQRKQRAAQPENPAHPAVPRASAVKYRVNQKPRRIIKDDEEEVPKERDLLDMPGEQVLAVLEPHILEAAQHFPHVQDLVEKNLRQPENTTTSKVVQPPTSPVKITGPETRKAPANTPEDTTAVLPQTNVQSAAPVIVTPAVITTVPATTLPSQPRNPAADSTPSAQTTAPSQTTVEGPTAPVTASPEQVQNQMADSTPSAATTGTTAAVNTQAVASPQKPGEAKPLPKLPKWLRYLILGAVSLLTVGIYPVVKYLQTQKDREAVENIKKMAEGAEKTAAKSNIPDDYFERAKFSECENFLIKAQVGLGMACDASRKATKDEVAGPAKQGPILTLTKSFAPRHKK